VSKIWRSIIIRVQPTNTSPSTHRQTNAVTREGDNHFSKKNTTTMVGNPLFHHLLRRPICLPLLLSHTGTRTVRRAAGGGRNQLGISQFPAVSFSVLPSICCSLQACDMFTEQSYAFGPYKIHQKEVFYSTDHSYAMVNLRPLLPVKRFGDLTAAETSDLWLTAQKVGSQLELFHKATSLTFAIQDGPQAGQTVPHVHIHILPRKGGDFENNDEIYDAIDVKEKELKQKLDLDKERKDRSLEEMGQEAEEYRQLFLQ
ncbi:Bifunctional bis(5'-adenosyl)-triphosphatase/adenylylsulfatase FHIT, partial [Linum grandiflorum]